MAKWPRGIGAEARLESLLCAAALGEHCAGWRRGISCHLGRFAPHVSAVEASVSATRHAPQRGEVHDVAARISC